MCTSLSDECVPLGCMMINSCARLCPLLQQVSLFALPNAPSLSDLDWEESDKDSGNPHWRAGSITTRVSPRWKKKMFFFNQELWTLWLHPTLIHGAASSNWIPAVETAKCASSTKTLLQVFCFPSYTLISRSTQNLCQHSQCSDMSPPGVVAQKSEVWFLDRSLCWHFLTSTFTSYYRLMITNLGLPEWQYAFTPYGPSPQAKVARQSIQVLVNQSALHKSDSFVHEMSLLWLSVSEHTFNGAENKNEKNLQDLLEIYVLINFKLNINKTCLSTHVNI